jgi:very-short-patch-repair endonuclease
MQRMPKFICGGRCESSCQITVFRRQHPIGSFVVDFACPSRKLVIELDGGQHAAQAQEDSSRTSALVRRGYRVIRFWNNEVMDNLAGVLDAIRRELDVQRE